jgi:DNA-binding FadR family transcriptional regulator
MLRRRLNSDFIRYLVADQHDNDDPERIPALGQLANEIGVSVSKLREQLEVARALGFVEVRPRTGIRRKPYSFAPAVRQSLSYAMALDPAHFDAYADLRNQVEAAYWHAAVCKLTPADHQYLESLVASAWEKLHGSPVMIPHREHRELHLAIYRRLMNPFVIGILEAFWDAYEAFGLNLYADYEYLEQVWNYHQQMVVAICTGDYDAGFQALTFHKDLLHHRPHLPAVVEDKTNGNV